MAPQPAIASKCYVHTDRVAVSARKRPAGALRYTGMGGYPVQYVVKRPRLMDNATAQEPSEAAKGVAVEGKARAVWSPHLSLSALKSHFYLPMKEVRLVRGSVSCKG